MKLYAQVINQDWSDFLPLEKRGDRRPAEGAAEEGLARLKARFPTPRDAIAYIMNTFPIIRRKEEEKYDGDYRTKRVILEIYDAMQEALRSGQPYQTKLDTPPGPPFGGLPGCKVGQLRPKGWPSHIHPPKEIRE